MLRYDFLFFISIFYRNFIATLGHYQTEATAMTNLDSQSTNSTDGDQTPTTPSGSQSGIIPTEEISVSGTPSNLLVTFLEYCSIAMQVSFYKRQL